MRKSRKKSWHILCAMMALVLMISNMPILDAHAEPDANDPVIVDQKDQSGDEISDDEASDENGSDNKDSNSSDGNLDGEENKENENPKKDSDTKSSEAGENDSDDKTDLDDQDTPEEDDLENQDEIVPQEEEKMPVNVPLKKLVVKVAGEDPEQTGVIYVNANSQTEEVEEDNSSEENVPTEETKETDTSEEGEAKPEDTDSKEEETASQDPDSQDIKEEAASDDADEKDEVNGEDTTEALSDDSENGEADTLNDEQEDDGTEVSAEAEGEPVVLEEVVEAKKGSSEKPCASLWDAVILANGLTRKDITIEIQSDLTETACARINGKDITIIGNGHTITRGDNFETISDNARSWYNPAMIEVCDPSHDIGASLRLENITLDDGSKTAGTKYSQASTNGTGGNGDIVQDAIIATYDGVGTITLGDKVTLKGYGGMSAVRLSGGVLIMESGSCITGGKDFNTKGGGNGPAGAVWIQGGTLTMNEGAKIDGVTGRAVYVDGGSATIGGTISNITANNNMWQGQSGAAIHVRGTGYAVLESSGIIEKISGNGGGYTGAIMTNGSRGNWLWDFEAKKGSVIRDVTGFPTVYSNYGTELLDGTISGCTNDFIIGGFAQKTTIGANGVIENCTAKSGAANSIVYTSNASKIYLQGKVCNNTASYGFYIINQSGGGASLEMYDGAAISGNSGSGVYVNASECSFTMHGGTIEKNKGMGVYVREKSSKHARFVMENGKIINNNSYGVQYATNTGSMGYTNITGGEIFGNGNNQVYVSGANAADEAHRIQIASGVVKTADGKSAAVGTSFGTLTLDVDYPEVYLGNAKAEASQKIKELVETYQTSNAYITRGNALWFKPTMGTLHFIADQPSSINKNNYLWAAYIPLKADGTPVDGAELTVVPVNNAAQVDVALSGLTSNQPYAMMWMQPDDSATGALQMTGTPSVQEELDREDEYTVEYTITYDPKNLRSSLKSGEEEGDIFTATVMLDPALSYTEGTMKLSSTTYFKQVGDVEYDAEQHKITFNFRYYKESKWLSPTATIKFNAGFDGSVFDTDIRELKSKAALKSQLKSGSEINLETVLPCVTKLISLAPYTVNFDSNGGSAVENQFVKPGKTASRPADPTRSGYTFNGWTLNGAAYNFTAPVTSDITLTAQWTANTTTGGGGGGTTGGGGGGTTPAPVPETTFITAPEVPLAAPAAATAPVAATVPATPEAGEIIAEVEEEEIPLATAEEPEKVEEPEAPVEVEEPEVPLASGENWALLNLLLMILTVIGGVVTMVGVARKKEEEYEEEDDKNSRMLHLMGIVPAVVSAVVFFLTENMRSPMVFVDKMTVIMICITVVEAAVIVLAYRGKALAKNKQS